MALAFLFLLQQSVRHVFLNERNINVCFQLTLRDFLPQFIFWRWYQKHEWFFRKFSHIKFFLFCCFWCFQFWLSWTLLDCLFSVFALRLRLSWQRQLFALHVSFSSGHCYFTIVAFFPQLFLLFAGLIFVASVCVFGNYTFVRRAEVQAIDLCAFCSQNAWKASFCSVGNSNDYYRFRKLFSKNWIFFQVKSFVFFNRNVHISITLISRIYQKRFPIFFLRQNAVSIEALHWIFLNPPCGK